MRKSKKTAVVIIVIILFILLSAGILGYLYMATDIFKSKQELFAKYLGQNIDVFQKMTNSQTVKTFQNLKNENKYEINTDIKLVHSEGGEISNPFNNLSAKFDIQKDLEEQYMYANGKVMYEEDEFFETEIIKEKDLYGVRFTDLVKQFLTIDKSKDFDIEEIGLDNKQLQVLENLTGVIANSKDKYINTITKTIENGMFEKDSLSEIKIYSVFVNSENVENMLIQILNDFKQDEQILEIIENIIDKETLVSKINEEIKKINEEKDISPITITVYEEKQKTIKTEIEIGSYKITIVNVNENGDITIQINCIDEQQSKEYSFEIKKENANQQENFSIAINGLLGENGILNLSSLIQVLDNNEIKFDIEFSELQDITKKAIKIENSIKPGNDFEKKETLQSNNNIVLNDINEASRTKIINQLTQTIQKNIDKNMDILSNRLGMKKEEIQEIENEMSQVDINKFNAKFEFYIGDEVSAQQVKSLLEVVKDNLKGYEDIVDNATEESENANKEKINIKLNIEKDSKNEIITNEIIEKIVNNKKYKVLIYYKDTNNLIDYITITEI